MTVISCEIMGHSIIKKLVVPWNFSWVMHRLGRPTCRPHLCLVILAKKLALSKIGVCTVLQQIF